MSTGEPLYHGLVVAAGAACSAYIVLLLLRRRSVIGVGALAVAVALAVLAAAAYFTVTARLHAGWQIAAAAIGPTLLAYASVYVVADRMLTLKLLPLLLTIVIGFVPLVYFGAHVWLVVGCGAAGECL